MTLTENEPTVRPPREQLMAEFGEADLSVQSPDRFCFVPAGRQELLIRTVIDPGLAYPQARAVSLRCDQLSGGSLESCAASALGEGED